MNLDNCINYFSLTGYSKNELKKYIEENDLNFTYGKATFKAYKQATHDSDGWVGRKFYIPVGLLVVSIKTIYHVALTIFQGIPKACFGNFLPLKNNVYCLVRDVEEALGYVLTLFSDRLGTYLVQESLFQKECYAYFGKKLSGSNNFSNQSKTHSSNTNSPKSNFFNSNSKQTNSSNFSSFSFTSNTFIDGVKIPHYVEAIKISLKNFKDMATEDQEEAIKKFELQDNIDIIGKQVFFEKLGAANEKVLELITIVDLKLNIQASKLKIAIQSDEEFKKLTISELKEVSFAQLKIIKQRLSFTNVKTSENFILPENILEVCLVHFSQLNADKINENISKIPGKAFSFLSDDQFKSLDFKNFTVLNLEIIFRYIDGKEKKRRFALLSETQVHDILEKLNPFQLKLISDEQLKGLNLKNAEARVIHELFVYIDGKEEKRRFALLSEPQVLDILEKLKPFQLKLISDEQLKGLNLKNAEARLIHELFVYIDGKEEKRRFALLSVTQVQDIFDKLTKFQLSLISDDHLKGLDLKNAGAAWVHALFVYIDGKEEKRRFALLSVTQVQDIFDKLTKYQLKLISDEQLKSLNLKNAGAAWVQGLFTYIDGKEEKRRFALLSVTQVNDIFDKLTKYELKLISDEQLKSLDLKNAGAEWVQGLFTYIDGKEEKRRFALLSVTQVQDIYDILTPFQLKLISDEQLKRLDLKNAGAAWLQGLFTYIDGKEEKRRFALLSVTQVNDIFDKLTKYQLKLISDEQLKSLDMSKISKTQVNNLFPSFSKETIREENKGSTFLSFSTYKNGKLTYSQKKSGISDNEVEEIYQERKKANAEKIALLSTEQINQIKDKLTPENQELLI